MSGFDPRDWYNQIAFGTVPNCTPWTKTGYNGAVGTTEADVWVAGGAYVWPTAAQQMEVVSSNAGDTGAGAGIQQARIGYLDASYVEKSVIVTLNGLAPVATGVGAADIFRVQSFRAVRVGVNGVASGNVDVRMIGGAATIFSRIGPGFTRARNQTWTVPAGKTLYVTSIVFSSGAAVPGKDVRFTTRANYDNANRRVLTPVNAFFMPFHEVIVQDESFYRRLRVPTVLPATVSLRVSVLSGANTAICESTLRGYLVTGTVP